jgi:hypothetical protein
MVSNAATAMRRIVQQWRIRKRYECDLDVLDEESQPGEPRL